MKVAEKIAYSFLWPHFDDYEVAKNVNILNVFYISYQFTSTT